MLGQADRLHDGLNQQPEHEPGGDPRDVPIDIGPRDRCSEQPADPRAEHDARLSAVRLCGEPQDHRGVEAPLRRMDRLAVRREGGRAPYRGRAQAEEADQQRRERHEHARRDRDLAAQHALRQRLLDGRAVRGGGRRARRGLGPVARRLRVGSDGLDGRLLDRREHLARRGERRRGRVFGLRDLELRDGLHGRPAKDGLAFGGCVLLDGGPARLDLAGAHVGRGRRRPGLRRLVDLLRLRLLFGTLGQRQRPPLRTLGGRLGRRLFDGLGLLLQHLRRAPEEPDLFVQLVRGFDALVERRGLRVERLGSLSGLRVRDDLAGRRQHQPERRRHRADQRDGRDEDPPHFFSPGVLVHGNTA
jgi:hypothetical protein